MRYVPRADPPHAQIADIRFPGRLTALRIVVGQFSLSKGLVCGIDNHPDFSGVILSPCLASSMHWVGVGADGGIHWIHQTLTH